MLNVLITGCGGPAAICIMKALDADTHRVFAADMDDAAAGLYLVPRSQRFIVPAGSSPEYCSAIERICQTHKIDVFIPTCDAELRAAGLIRETLDAMGTRTLLASNEFIRLCLDKWRLFSALEGLSMAPQTTLFERGVDFTKLVYPMIAKPRFGSGSRGIELIQHPLDLQQIPIDGSYILQEYLPGKEFSVDVACAKDGGLIAAVPRERIKVDSGVVVTSRTLHHPLLDAAVRTLVDVLNPQYVINAQFKLDVNGVPRLLEINPRFPGGMSLTVHAGHNMPQIAVNELMDRPWRTRGDFDDVVMVRTFHETFFEPRELGKTAGPVFVEPSLLPDFWD